MNSESVESLLRKSPWTVERNDGECQCLSFDDGLAMAAFYSPGAVTVDNRRLKVDSPCIAQWKDSELLLCDPTHEGRTVLLEWNGAEHIIELPMGGRVIQVEL